MADKGDAGALDRDPRARVAGGGRPLPARPLHDRRTRGDDPPLGGGAAPRRGTPLRGGRAKDTRLDDDGDARRPLAPPRRGWLPAGARSDEGGELDRLTIAVPVKGRL